MQPEEARSRIAALGFSATDTETLAAHFDDAERRGKRGHGHARIEWLETATADLDPSARAERELSTQSYEVWDGAGALGYLTLSAVCDAQIAKPPEHARVVVAKRCFPTGVLGYWVRRLADAGLVAVLTATSPRRLSHPEGSPPLAGTNPLAIGIPSSDGKPVVVDVSPAKATWGDVIAGHASEDDVVPFGGDHAHKSFALAIGLQLLVDALTGAGNSESRAPEHGALLVVARPAGDPVPALRALAGGARLPGDR
ncbi:MAG TPA: Ldh family oxidoreductase [Gaiellaceae bacterium]|nr:Ldh family oxidoreductase [Gaiellaceae bacterium]